VPPPLEKTEMTSLVVGTSWPRFIGSRVKIAFNVLPVALLLLDILLNGLYASLNE